MARRGAALRRSRSTTAAPTPRPGVRPLALRARPAPPAHHLAPMSPSSRRHARILQKIVLTTAREQAFCCCSCPAGGDTAPCRRSPPPLLWVRATPPPSPSAMHAVAHRRASRRPHARAVGISMVRPPGSHRLADCHWLGAVGCPAMCAARSLSTQHHSASGSQPRHVHVAAATPITCGSACMLRGPVSRAAAQPRRMPPPTVSGGHPATTMVMG